MAKQHISATKKTTKTKTRKSKQNRCPTCGKFRK